MAAVFVGSGAGAALGGAYLAAKPASHASTPPVAAAAPLAAAPATARASAPTATLATLTAARPFRFAAVAAGASDVQCLTEAVYFEARGEPERGQQAVAQVVLNRVRHPAFPKTVCAVVHQRTDAGCQFSFACKVQPAGRDEDAWRRAEAVAKAALHGAVVREIGDATHFASARASAFAGLLKVARIGEQVFYRFGGRAGAADMFHQTPAPSAAPRMVMASLTEPVPAAIAQAPTPSASAGTAAVATASQTSLPASELRLATRPALAAPAVTSDVVKSLPAVTLKPAVVASPVAQS
jgi:spore germination cell wall hydrolase CwlJ-like protein